MGAFWFLLLPVGPGWVQKLLVGLLLVSIAPSGPLLGSVAPAGPLSEFYSPWRAPSGFYGSWWVPSGFYGSQWAPLGSIAPGGPLLGSIAPGTNSNSSSDLGPSNSLSVASSSNTAGESPSVGCSEQPLEPPLKRANSAIVGGSDLRSRPQAFREDHPIELLITQVHHLRRS